MDVAPIPRQALLDVRRVMRALYAARRAGGATYQEQSRIAALGDDVLRLVRRERFGADARLWSDTRRILRLVLGLCRDLPAELAPGVRALLEAAARPILGAPEQPGETAIATVGSVPVAPPLPPMETDLGPDFRTPTQPAPPRDDERG